MSADTTTPLDVVPAAVSGADVMKSAMENLRIRWVVRQKVSTAHKGWLVDVSDSEYERVARMDYDRLVRENTDAYFELVAVANAEVCCAFTPK